MPSNAADDTLIQPDYATKPVTYLRDVVLKAISFVPKGANGKRFFLFKNEQGTGETDELVAYSELIKEYNPTTPDDWEIAYCVIAVPGDEDLQKDVWDEQEIKKACHAFIPSGGLLNENHTTLDAVGQLVENALALADFTIDTPDGTTETIKKGSWYIAVQPNATIKAKMINGEIGGMSVQGSAQREEATGELVKADKSDRAIAIGTTGDGIKKLQHILGVEETGKYDLASEAGLTEWMKLRGVPGLPSVATLRLCITDPATPVEVTAPATASALPVEGGESPVIEKQGFQPAALDNTPSVPLGAQGVDPARVTVDSSGEDLKALIAQAIHEGNEALERHMSEKYSGASVGDLYGQEISHEDLWYLVSKFILATAPSINAEGEYETGEPEVEKGAAVDDAPEAAKPEAPTLHATVAEILSAGGPVEEQVRKIRLAAAPKVGEQDPSLAALTKALTDAVQEEDAESRTATVTAILKDFARYMRRTKESAATAPEDSRKPDASASATPTFLNKGEDMDRTLIDEKTAASLATAVDFITNAIGGGESTEVPAEVEKEGVPDAFKGKKAPEFGTEDAPAPKADTPEDSPKAEGDLEDALSDEGDEVSEEELLQVMNHLVEEVDHLNERLTALEQLDSKLDKVGELAKALTASDEVTEKVEKFAAELEEISKAVSASATQDAVAAITGRVESVSKRLDGIAKTPSRSGAIPVDIKKSTAPQAVAKSHTDNPWSDPSTNVFR